MALDRLTRRGRFREVLDLGCGSGVLAIALTRTLPRARILASDLDTQSVTVARANMAINGAARRITAVAADGFEHPALRTPAAFDLIVANILAAPLIMLAPKMRRALRANATLVVSGVLVGQAPQVVAAYRSQGFAVMAHARETGWSTLILRRRS
jgi:ribosomal protein L11 methyltransferase